MKMMISEDTTTIDMNPLSPTYNQSVRGFRLFIPHKGKTLVLPCAGGAYYTGQEALKIMHSYAKRGICITSVCEANGIEERLSLGEMQTIYA